MSQNSVIMAFRKRLRKRGYTNISIRLVSGYRDLYNVSAVEPLSRYYCHVELSLYDMGSMFRF